MSKGETFDGEVLNRISQSKIQKGTDSKEEESAPRPRVVADVTAGPLRKGLFCNPDAI
jgi:hypothetical protein